MQTLMALDYPLTFFRDANKTVNSDAVGAEKANKTVKSEAPAADNGRARLQGSPFEIHDHTNYFVLKTKVSKKRQRVQKRPSILSGRMKIFANVENFHSLATWTRMMNLFNTRGQLRSTWCAPKTELDFPNSSNQDSQLLDGGDSGVQETK